MPTVNPAFAINGGSVGAKASVSAASSVTATIDDIAGIDSVVWAIVATDETSDPSDYTLVQSGVKGETVTTTSLGAGTAAILQATVNAGVDPNTGNVSTALTATGKFYVVTSPGGLEVGCVGETYQSDPTFGATGEINSAIRTAGGGSGVAYATGGQLSTINAGDAAAAGSSGAVTRADHQHPVATATPGAIAIGDSAAEGASTSLARADHTHSLAAPAAPADVTKAAAAAGSSSSPARADHKHDVSTAAPSTVGTSNTEGSSSSLARADHVHDHGAQTGGSLHALAVSGSPGTPGFLSGPFAQDLTDATATPTASKLAKFGASAQLSAAFFASTGTVAGTGILRCTSNSTPVAAKDSGNNDAALLAWSAADVLTAGDAARAAGIDLSVKTGGSVVAKVNSSTKLDVKSTGVGIGDTLDAGSGDGVVSLAVAATAPTADPTGRIILYSGSGELATRSKRGVVTTVAPVGTSSNTTQLYDWQVADVATTNATPALLLTLTVPTSVVGRITYSVMAKSGDTCNWYERIVRVRHDGANAVLVETLTPTGIADREDIGAGCDITIAQSGSTITLTVTGIAATNIEWSVEAHAAFHRA